MTVPEIRKRLLKITVKKLPGESSHLKMMPKNRIKKITPDKKSAVLILLFPDKDTYKVVFIKRAENDGIHSGQIAFPGGKFEKADKKTKNTALREAKEEIGINPDNVTIIKELTPLNIPVSGFTVFPFAGIYEGKPVFVKNEKEVAAIFTLDIKELLKATVKTKIIFVRGEKITAPFYIFDEFEIWGASAMILSEFIDLTKSEFSE